MEDMRQKDSKCFFFYMAPRLLALCHRFTLTINQCVYGAESL